ncbi:phytoene dehydrogenase domain protein [Mycobacterium intracellulare]|nr:phytoene dehydrogenase domain protein [Mycobacterium intracellulare]
MLTTELPQTYALLGRTPRRAVRLRASPSAVVAHLGCPRSLATRPTTPSCSARHGIRPSPTSSATAG